LGEAFVAAVHIINTLPTKVLNGISPFQKIFNQKPDYTFYRTFGCACYPLVGPYNKSKLNFRSEICRFLGYNNQNKGYICLSTSSKRYISRHVVFNEELFPFTFLDNPLHTSIKQTCTPSICDNLLIVIQSATTITPAPHSTLTGTTVISHGNNSAATSNAANSAQPAATSNAANSAQPAANSDFMNSVATSNAANSVVCPASTTMPIQIEDTPQIIQNIHPMVTRAKSSISKPKIYSVSASEIEPTNFKEALSNLVWYDAMKSEYNALVLNNTDSHGSSSWCYYCWM